MMYLMIDFSVFDPSKINQFHITKKSGYLSVFDPSKKEGKAQQKAGPKHQETRILVADDV